LEKEPGHRTQSADDFARELRESMSKASATLKRTGDRSAADLLKTMVTPPPRQEPSIPPASLSKSDPMAGTISSASIEEEEQKNLVAQQELAREAEAKRKLAEQAEAQRQATDRAEAERKAAEEVEAKRVAAEQEEQRRLVEEQKRRDEEVSREAERKR